MKMESGEKIVLALQFGLLVAVVLVIGNLLPSQLLSPGVNAVYWGQPAGGSPIPDGGTLRVSQNASEITAYLLLPSSTTLSSASASRICVNQTMHSGEVRTFNSVAFAYDHAHSQEYYIVSPVAQRNGWSCTYTIQLSDSRGDVTKWTGTVVVG